MYVVISEHKSYMWQITSWETIITGVWTSLLGLEAWRFESWGWFTKNSLGLVGLKLGWILFCVMNGSIFKSKIFVIGVWIGCEVSGATLPFRIIASKLNISALKPGSQGFSIRIQLGWFFFHFLNSGVIIYVADYKLGDHYNWSVNFIIWAWGLEVWVLGVVYQK